VDVRTKYTVSVVDNADGLGGQGGAVEREEAMKKYYAGKLSHIQSQCNAADARATELLRENERAAQAYNSVQVTVRQLEAALAAVETCQEETLAELETARVNYEGQIKLLTEQCIELSEQSQRLDKERKTLKSHKVLCGRCKSWNSVAWLIQKGQNGQICSKGNHPSGYNFA